MPHLRRAYGRTLPLLLALTACEGGQSALDPAGAQAAAVRQLWWLMLGVSVLVFTGVVAFLTLALLRQRRASRERLQPGQLERDDARSRRWVAGAVGATVLLLMVLFGGNMAASRHAAGLEGDEDAWIIDVQGHQWWWDVRYIQEDRPSLSVRTANEIHLPAGESVLLRLRSRDVIHSLWMPTIGGKLDLVPGRENILWVRAERPGVYRGQCAEFCGMQHANMALMVVVHEPAEFEAWLAHQRRAAPEPTTAVQQRGRDVFMGSACATCHEIRGTLARAQAGPDLTHVASRLTLGSATVPNLRGPLTAWILDPQGIKPGNHMPRVALSPDDLAALTAYLDTLE